MEILIIVKLMIMALMYIPDPQGYDFEKSFNTSTECADAKSQFDDSLCAGTSLYVRKLSGVRKE
jgi:hypothetical protein